MHFNPDTYELTLQTFQAEQAAATAGELFWALRSDLNEAGYERAEAEVRKLQAEARALRAKLDAAHAQACAGLIDAFEELNRQPGVGFMVARIADGSNALAA